MHNTRQYCPFCSDPIPCCDCALVVRRNTLPTIPILFCSFFISVVGLVSISRRTRWFIFSPDMSIRRRRCFFSLRSSGCLFFYHSDFRYIKIWKGSHNIFAFFVFSVTDDDSVRKCRGGDLGKTSSIYLEICTPTYKVQEIIDGFLSYLLCR